MDSLPGYQARLKYVTLTRAISLHRKRVRLTWPLLLQRLVMTSAQSE